MSSPILCEEYSLEINYGWSDLKLETLLIGKMSIVVYVFYSTLVQIFSISRIHNIPFKIHWFIRCHVLYKYFQVLLFINYTVVLRR